MLMFNALGLSPDLMKGIEELGFVSPTPIQEKMIPVALSSSSDLIGLAQTGTGKTAAFGLPILEQTDTTSNKTQSLILAPTRELCMQIAKDLQNFSKYIKGLNVVAVYGGASIDTQIRQIRQGAHIIVATPGRMVDLIGRGAVSINTINNVVLDEADEMLNMGFKEDLDTILEETPATKRTLLFSATMSNEVARIADNYLHSPQKITIGKQNQGAVTVSHVYYQVHARDRYLALKRIADINPDIYGIIFCRTRMETKEVADKLIKDGYNADALHGDLSQAQRDYVMGRFRERTLQMLVATDVAARGIDVSDITHVINYNLPDDIEVYTHRSGRTGRASKSGVSISIVNYREVKQISQIEKIIGKKCERMLVPSGPEICQRQLLGLIDRMEKVVVDEEQISQFMSAVYEKLEQLTKEDIIKKFVSLEFNRFLEYYKDAVDLNEKAKEGISDKGRRERGDRSRDERDERSGRSDRRDTGGKERVRSDRRKSSANMSRFFLNVGKKDRIEPQHVIGMINDATQDRDIRIGAIDIKGSFSFFEVGEQHKDTIIRSFKDQTFKGINIRVELADASTDTEFKTEKSSEGRPERFSEKRSEKRPERSSDRRSERSSDRRSERSSDRRSERSTDKRSKKKRY